ncbi:MCE family protein [Mucilaginibacter sp. BJC16-A38]|uniref:MlaD family protein n=1 Tax=Mucilaginibacter phenanthrenivorans TaxID=1234842 RepID=UPI0021570718|nr:MlaD family protein [Mucilaginibacter phenanthrenivorans]MCR8560792.1 MCE family protein [Mucilaginibacter phenanthrenivorans]
MANQGGNNIKLGVFVLAGLFVLILSFYMIGKNHNLFGSDFRIKARFSNLNGLMEGNNVLFAGIQAGTVKSIELINDTTIEVTLLIDNKVRSYIHKNAVAAIGTEGLMGNKIVNILPSKTISPKVEEGDLLAAQKMVNTDEMLQTLSKTNNNIAIISDAIKGTVLRINSSALLDLLNDKSIGVSLKSSLKNINKATANANEITYGLNNMVTQIKKGKGGAGVLLSDTAFAGNLQDAVLKIKLASGNANKLTLQLNSLVGNLNQELIHGKGPLNTLLRDSVMANNLKGSMDNIQKGTDGFNQNMEALKHNFLFRGYFKNLEKAQKKKNAVSQ